MRFQAHLFRSLSTGAIYYLCYHADARIRRANPQLDRMMKGHV